MNLKKLVLPFVVSVVSAAGTVLIMGQRPKPVVEEVYVNIDAVDETPVMGKKKSKS